MVDVDEAKLVGQPLQRLGDERVSYCNDRVEYPSIKNGCNPTSPSSSKYKRLPSSALLA